MSQKVFKKETPSGKLPTYSKAVERANRKRKQSKKVKK
jgi:hypothetical protein